MNNAIIINGKDNVCVALREIKKGERLFVGEYQIEAAENIPAGHKIALEKIHIGENVIKYGYPIGHATCDILPGAHVHVHNLKTNLDGKLEYSYDKPKALTENTYKSKKTTFMGYKRKDGSVGIRNEIWIIPTVGCVNKTAENISKKANKELVDGVGGVYAYTHDMGCSQLGDDHKTTQKILSGLIKNPNAAGVLVLSLGCENNNLESFIPALGEYDSERVKFLVCQDCEDECEEGIKIVRDLMKYACAFKRSEQSISQLTVGFKCGGSDGFSGITANALCGRANNLITGMGGSTILTEVPEMFGGETILMGRAVDKDVFLKTVELINGFKEYYERYNQTIYENPSPGNKKGGISTLEDKSLGCIQKGGESPVVDVLGYGESVKKHGLNLLTGPGNDRVSCTNLVASGAQIILFTTGRGNPFGAPVPTVKISSNTPLYNKKEHWIDIDAGKLILGKTFEEMTEELLEYIIDIASGKKFAKNELMGYREISIFKDGVIL